jgi:hypothetical protein
MFSLTYKHLCGASHEPISRIAPPSHLEQKMREIPWLFATKNAKVNRIVIRIDPFPPRRQASGPITKPWTTQPTSPDKPVSKIDRSRGQVGNLSHGHTSEVLKAFRISHDGIAVASPLQLWVKL